MNFNSFEQSYSKNDVNWHKSVGEISNFILNHLDKREFCDFLEGQEIDYDKVDRWRLRLDELLDKITKRMGYRIDKNKLFSKAYYEILEKKNNGELNPSKNLDYFCNNIDYLIAKIDIFNNN